MAHIFQILLGNLATVALVITVWAHMAPALRPRFGLSREAFFGMAMAAGAGISMAMSVEIEPGVYFDLRSGLVVAAALFGGAVAAGIAAGLAIIFRLWMGGAGVVIGVGGILIAAILSLLARRIAGSKIGFGHIAVLALVESAAAYLLGSSALSPLHHSSASVGYGAVGLNFLCIVISGSLMLEVRRFTAERHLLRAALAQSPDFYYVKDRQSRFRFANEAVARFNRFDNPAAMTGLSDFDLTERQRAEALFQSEQQIMASGGALVDREECLDTDNGERWFLTSKVAVRGDDGDVIGLAGITRDITTRKTLEREVTQNRDLLNQIMRDMSDGLMVFDASGHLVFCNDRCREYFPSTAHLRVPGTHIRTLLEGVIATGEQVNLPRDRGAWIVEASRVLFTDGDHDIQTEAGRWLQIRTRVTCNGLALAVVTDMTALKESELAFRSLAETDGLTGLSNRRAFDEAFGQAFDRATPTKPLSVVMIDVDRFKAYNDHYGHLMGDDCLKRVAKCLERHRRPGQMMARFGGEEFVVLLPNTSLSTAADFAEQFRSEMQSSEIEHARSEYGVVTVSLGIAAYSGEPAELSMCQLLRDADTALYDAKNAGRNCARVHTPSYGPPALAATG